MAASPPHPAFVSDQSKQPDPKDEATAPPIGDVSHKPIDLVRDEIDALAINRPSHFQRTPRVTGIGSTLVTVSASCDASPTYDRPHGPYVFSRPLGDTFRSSRGKGKNGDFLSKSRGWPRRKAGACGKARSVHLLIVSCHAPIQPPFCANPAKSSPSPAETVSIVSKRSTTARGTAAGNHCGNLGKSEARRPPTLFWIVDQSRRIVRIGSV